MKSPEQRRAEMAADLRVMTERAERAERQRDEAHATIRALVQGDDKAVIAKVRGLHAPNNMAAIYMNQPVTCWHCKVEWPCKTRRIVDGENT